VLLLIEDTLQKTDITSIRLNHSIVHHQPPALKWNMPKSTKSPGKAAPKSVLDKIVHAIRSSPPGANSGVSRVSITKYLKSEFDYDNASQIKLALKRGVSNGLLAQKGQSFTVAKDPARILAAQGEPLQMEDVKEGKGPGAERGDTVTVQYAGTLEDKTKFDSAKSFEFLLGAGDVIKGWDQGLVGMAVGGKRKLVVPSHLGYGKRGCAPDIPPSSTLYFDVTMKKIVKQEE
jgi:FKBP-type peptidyl-prolyl cis-trans isomerase